MAEQRNPEIARGAPGFSHLWIAMPIISLVVGPITFIIGWVYAISEFGFFLGVGIGWIPALFIGYFAAILTKSIMLILVIAFALEPMREVSLADLRVSRPSSGRIAANAKMKVLSRDEAEQRKRFWGFFLGVLYAVAVMVVVAIATAMGGPSAIRG